MYSQYSALAVCLRRKLHAHCATLAPLFQEIQAKEVLAVADVKIAALRAMKVMNTYKEYDTDFHPFTQDSNFGHGVPDYHEICTASTMRRTRSELLTDY